jgi:hypothetical protein
VLAGSSVWRHAVLDERESWFRPSNKPTAHVNMLVSGRMDVQPTKWQDHQQAKKFVLFVLTKPLPYKSKRVLYNKLSNL